MNSLPDLPDLEAFKAWRVDTSQFLPVALEIAHGPRPFERFASRLLHRHQPRHRLGPRCNPEDVSADLPRSIRFGARVADVVARAALSPDPRNRRRRRA